jgi:hypothetical protein
VLRQIAEWLEKKKVFRRQRKNHKIKVIAILLYPAGISYRKTNSIIEDLELFSYEVLQKWYKLCIVFFCFQNKQRRVIAVDETKMK